MQRALQDARIDSGALSHVVLAGGATRMPAVRRLVAQMFGRVPSLTINPDEVVFRGAAVQAAAVLAGAEVQEMRRAWAPRTEVVATPRPGTAELRCQLLERYLSVAEWTGFDGQAQR